MLFILIRLISLFLLSSIGVASLVLFRLFVPSPNTLADTDDAV